MKVDLRFFTEMKSKHKILIIIGGVLLISAIGKGISAAVKRKTSIKSFGDENISIAKRLFNALYPEGKPDSKFSIWNPFSIGNVVGDIFKSNADIDTLMRIAGNDLTTDNFKSVAKAYDKLYDSSLLFDLQNRMDEDYKAFDDKIRKQSSINRDPEQKARVIRTLALNMYKDMDAWPTFSVNDSLYNQLNQMSDEDFIATNKEYSRVLAENGEDGTMRTWIDDDSRTMDAYNSISDRLNELGLE